MRVHEIARVHAPVAAAAAALLDDVEKVTTIVDHATLDPDLWAEGDAVPGESDLRMLVVEREVLRAGLAARSQPILDDVVARLATPGPPGAHLVLIIAGRTPLLVAAWHGLTNEGLAHLAGHLADPTEA